LGVSDRQILIFKKLNQVPVGSQPYKKMPYIFYFDIFISNQIWLNCLMDD
jgi:hypothetical protein